MYHDRRLLPPSQELYKHSVTTSSCNQLGMGATAPSSNSACSPALEYLAVGRSAA